MTPEENSTSPSLNGLINQTVGMQLTFLNPTRTTRVAIHAVEATGIWIESQDFTEMMMEARGSQITRATPLLFVPFSQIVYIVASIDKPSISERLVK